jgi:periplasmic protein TonB
MSSKISLYSKKWCETIFEGKNKDFGAYELRRDSNKRHAQALLFVVASISLAAGLPTIIDKVIQDVRQENVEIANISQIKLEMDNIPDMPEEPITAEDITKSGDKPAAKESKLDMTGSITIESNGERTEVGTKAKESEVDDFSWKDDSKSFSEKKEELEPADSEAVMSPEEMPMFDGKDALSAFRDYMAKNLKYPENVEILHVQGIVYVQFVVERSGKLSNIRILRGVHPDIDNEVVRIIKSSPAWTPGKQKGKLVRVAYTFPIVFQID